MTVALWIIAIVETIRMIEQSVQLRLIAKDTGARDNVYDELIKSFKASDREYVRNLLEAFDKQDKPQIGYCNECKWFGDKQMCGICRSKNLYVPKDEPQTDCAWK